MRLAIVTLESLANAVAVRRFVAEHASDIALVGLSNPYRANVGGRFGQSLRNLRRSGYRFVPYLLANFVVPETMMSLRAVIGSKQTDTTPLSRLCRDRGLPLVPVEDVRGAAFRAALQKAEVDLIVSFHFDQIFDAVTLALARFGGINVHPSLLPHHRGPVPTFYALLDAEPGFGVTIHRLVEKIDAGAILAQQKVVLPGGTTALGAARALHETGRALLEQVLADFPAASAAAREMTPLPYCPFPTPKSLREAEARGVRLADWRDFQAAFRV